MWRNRLSFVADAVNHDNPPAFHKEPEQPRIQLPNVTQLKQSVANRLAERLGSDLHAAGRVFDGGGKVEN